MKRILTAVTMAIGLGAASGAAAEPVAIGTLPQGSLGYSIASGVAQIAAEKGGINARAVGQGGSSVFIPALNNGEIAFATSNTFEAVFAVTGTGNFDGRPNPNVRVAAFIQPFAVGFMVAADSDIQTVTDLKGRDFPVGYARQGLVKVMQDAIFAAADMSEDDLRGVPVANFVEAANLLTQGEVSGVLLAPGSGVVKRTHAVRPVRFISIPQGAEANAIIQDQLPGAFVRRVEPSDRLPEIAEAVDLLGYQYAILTHKDVSDDTVYALVKALYDNKDALVETHGSFRAFTPADMATQIDGAPFHPGAVRFYREAGLLD
ncbi:TAXI family TRAP transporter solute-binding subunit [Aestuariivita sp.]|jgi:TRAP transporter TAXI family solute receptor|uniref:TAXI family TRAP transporter solute-binding subunit n=1 Tax=Aestuariivita sp. TaxID=1872407 RepID=UPI00216CD15A|nr:TAXI family TRAP transporter solute-binding subunit [Aestuariivita sp.]MCE8005622.1 TAXI family TRAP transporter solute-binding subunit [Aestuariivita sp.]